MNTIPKNSSRCQWQPYNRPYHRFLSRLILLLGGFAASCGPAVWADEPQPASAASVSAAELTAAIQRSLALLETASAGSADQRKCFTCHSQAHPVIVLAEAQRRGFKIDQDNLDRQVRHTAKHLERGRRDYVDGRGQGGKADTAGYALWTLQSGGFHAAKTTDPVTSWLLQQQQESGHWKRSSDRPPSEASHFTTTYLALRGIGQFSGEQQQSEVTSQFALAQQWLTENKAEDTEDRVFRLLALQLVEAPDDVLRPAAEELLATQREDGGWAQLESLKSDAYATGTALFALHQSNQLQLDDATFQKGLSYLIGTQLDDGSWHVVSRSVPFQAYYETGFPHGKDQFISTSATAWATLSLLLTQPVE